MLLDAPVKSDAKSVGLLRRTFQRHRFWILGVWLLATAATCGWVGMNVRPVYEAFSILRVEPPLAGMHGATTNSESFESRLKTQVQLLTSPDVLDDGGKDPRVAKLPRLIAAVDVIQALKNVITVDIRPGTNLIRVSMKSHEPSETAPIVNAVVDAYLATNEEWGGGLKRQTMKNLGAYLQELHDKSVPIDHQWSMLLARERNEKRWGTNTDKDQNENREENGRESAMFKQYQRMNDEFLDIDLQLAETRAMMETAKTAAAKAMLNNTRAQKRTVLKGMIARRFSSDPEVMNLVAQMIEALEQRNLTYTIVGYANSTVFQAARTKIDSLQKKYDELWALKSKAWQEEAERGGPNMVSPEQEVRAFVARVEALEARKSSLEQKIAELKMDDRVRTLAGDIQLVTDQRDSIKAMEKVARHRFDRLYLESEAETRVRKVSAATIPTKPISDRRSMLLAMTPFVMILLVASFFVGYEAVNTRNYGSSFAEI